MVLRESFAASTGTKAPTSVFVRKGVRITASTVVHTVNIIDNGTSPPAIKLT